MLGQIHECRQCILTKKIRKYNAKEGQITNKKEVFVLFLYGND